MEQYVQSALKDQATGAALPYAICDRQREVVVGTTRFLDLDYWSWPPKFR